MPYTVRKVRNKPCYRVSNKKTKKIYSKCATKENAKKQVKLLRAVENNPKFVEKLRNTTRKNRGAKK
jgi:hypothetical protein